MFTEIVYIRLILGGHPDDPNVRHCYVLKSENTLTNTNYYECVFKNCNSKILMRDGIKRHFNASSDRSVENYQNNFILIDIETAVKEKSNDPAYDNVKSHKLYQDVMNCFKGTNITLPTDHKEKQLQLIKYYRLKRKRESATPVCSPARFPSPRNDTSCDSNRMQQPLVSSTSMENEAPVTIEKVLNESYGKNDIEGMLKIFKIKRPHHVISANLLPVIDITDLPSDDDDNQHTQQSEKSFNNIRVKQETLEEMEKNSIDGDELLRVNTTPDRNTTIPGIFAMFFFVVIKLSHDDF